MRYVGDYLPNPPNCLSTTHDAVLYVLTHNQLDNLSATSAATLVHISDMSNSTFVSQPTFFILKPKSTSKPTQSTAPPLVSALHTLSLAPYPPRHPKSNLTPLSAPFPSSVSISFHSPPPAATPSNTVIVWFRTDLRLHDHPALVQAIDHAASGTIIPLFIFDPRDYGKTPFGFEKTGRYRAKFLIDSVHSLRKSLRHLGSDLLIRIGHPEQVLPQLSAQTAATAIFCHSNISLNATKLESVLQSKLRRVGVDFCPMWNDTLYHLDDLPFSIDHLPEVYSTYREQVQSKSQIRPPLPAPKTIPRPPHIEVGDIPSLSQLGLTEPRAENPTMDTYVGGEKEALERLSAFVNENTTEHAGFSSPGHLGADFSCRISPWLALGCVSPRKIYADLTKAASQQKQAAIYFDLVWRDFFRYISVKYNRAKIYEQSPTRAVATAS